MKRNVLIVMVALPLALLLFWVGMKAYFEMKSDSALEAANVFVSPSHINLFNEHFTPYPGDQAQKCYALNNKLKKSRNLKLIMIGVECTHFRLTAITAQFSTYHFMRMFKESGGLSAGKNSIGI